MLYTRLNNYTKQKIMIAPSFLTLDWTMLLLHCCQAIIKREFCNSSCHSKCHEQIQLLLVKFFSSSQWLSARVHLTLLVFSYLLSHNDFQRKPEKKNMLYSLCWAVLMIAWPRFVMWFLIHIQYEMSDNSPILLTVWRFTIITA